MNVSIFKTPNGSYKIMIEVDGHIFYSANEYSNAYLADIHCDEIEQSIITAVKDK